MVQAIAIPATLIGLYALWVVGRIDFLRLIQGVYHTRGRVVRHVSGDGGFVAVYAFDHAGIGQEAKARLAFPKPEPAVGTSSLLSYPKRRPDLARTPEPFARSIMYAGFAAWLGFFSDLWLGWL